MQNFMSFSHDMFKFCLLKYALFYLNNCKTLFYFQSKMLWFIYFFKEVLMLSLVFLLIFYFLTLEWLIWSELIWNIVFYIIIKYSLLVSCSFSFFLVFNFELKISTEQTYLFSYYFHWVILLFPAVSLFKMIKVF